MSWRSLPSKKTHAHTFGCRGRPYRRNSSSSCCGPYRDWATFATSRVKSLALARGFSETASGELVHYAGNGPPDFVIRRFNDAPGRPANNAYYSGLTFALDLPQVADPPGALQRMVDLAEGFARDLGGELVDDNRRPLTEAGIANLRRSLDRIAQDMESQGIPAGSALARRLFT